MARDVYSLRIFAEGSLTSATGVVGPVVPPGFVYVVRDIDVAEKSGGDFTVLLVLGQVEQTLTAFLRRSTDLLGVFQWRGRQVYNEGEQVAVQVASGTWDVAISGYQLTLP